MTHDTFSLVTLQYSISIIIDIRMNNITNQ